MGVKDKSKVLVDKNGIYAHLRVPGGALMLMIPFDDRAEAEACVADWKKVPVDQRIALLGQKGVSA